MAIIDVRQLSKEFTYYKKSEGVKGSLKNLFKREKITKRAVDGVSFSVEAGEIVGFLGPNGAGKTTTLKMLSGILFPSCGTADVMGFVPWERKDEYKRQFAFVAGQKSQLWPDLPAVESFRLNKSIYQISDASFKNILDEMVELLCVQDFLNVQVRRLSLGERMKMEIISSLLHSPRLLFLDEPTIGLDIVSQENIRAFIKKYNQLNKTTIVLTSHYMRDIEELCERAIVINHGAKIYDGKLSEIHALSQHKRVVEIELLEKTSTSTLEQFGKVVFHSDSKAKIEIDGQMRSIVANMLEHLPIHDLSIKEIPIEESMAMLYNGKKEGIS